jgi:hypothetical protein
LSKNTPLLAAGFIISNSIFLGYLEGIMMGHSNNLTLFILILILIITLPGCAIYYWDAKTGAEHIWGIGHLATKISAPEDGKQVVISKATLVGINFGIEEGKIGVSTGWDKRERIMIYDGNTSISILRPENNNFFLFKFGSQPFIPTLPKNNNQ